MGQPVVFAIGYNHEGRYAMFESIKALIPDLFESARPRTAAKGHGSWLATAALLTRVATVHDEMSAGRREKLYTILKSAFQLDDLAAAQLIDQSAEVARNAVDLYRFTRKLREVLDDEPLSDRRMMVLFTRRCQMNLCQYGVRRIVISSRQRRASPTGVGWQGRAGI
jgi:uncharacterized tellurite resistance protein B-like protein